jgi:hypothetical protein
VNDLINSLWDKIGEVAIIVAFIALLGVVLKAVSDWFATSRSKYVDVVATERIKWVGELRKDLAEFGFNLDEVSHQCRQRPLDKAAANNALEEVNKRLAIIQLKLNLDHRLDRTLYALLTRSVFVARTGMLQEYADAKSLMTQVCGFLLKDEWEKAKRETAGPLRWLWLVSKHHRRRRKRKAFFDLEQVQTQLKQARRPLTDHEKERLQAAGV